MGTMNKAFFEIRVCESCGLRYPLQAGHSFGTRCPLCLGGTRVVLERELLTQEAGTNFPAMAAAGKAPRAVLLDNIRSGWNVGSILRTADGFGFERAFLCGITPGVAAPAVQKTALGAEQYVACSAHHDAVQLAGQLKKEGWLVAALEEDARARALAEYVPDAGRPLCLVVGNEVTGVDPGLLGLADVILYIPMRGRKRSYNVANAFSIAAYALGVS